MEEDLFSFSNSNDLCRDFNNIEGIESINKLIANIIHQLNDPLSAILGFSEVLQSLDMEPEIKKYIGNIHISALRSVRIVEGLLTFIRKKESEFTAININDVLRQTVSLFQYQMRTRNISLAVKLSPELPVMSGDFYRMQQVFFNVLMNAMQALEDWHRDRRMTIMSEAADNKIMIMISDNGPGIDAENINKIFNPFFSTTPKATGLGLSIAHGIVKEHGGNITVKSAKGEGCTFIIELPAVSGIPHKEDGGHNGASIRNGKKALIVDNDELVMDAMSSLMRVAGCDIVFAATAQDALEKLKKSDFDIILVEYKMADMNGFEFIRKASDFVSSKKLVLMTSDVYANAEAIKREYNMQVLFKPFGIKELRKVISVNA